MWDFQTDPEFQSKLDWMQAFVREECEPLDLLFSNPGDPYDVNNAASRAILAPLRERVKAEGLWACHLGPELGGKGFGQVKLALMNEIIGRSMWAPSVFGTAAPDTGNAEILAMFGSAEQKRQYLQPLLDGEIVSTFSMTEPQAGADPKEFTCSAVRDGDQWVIDGEKWFSSNGRYAEFFLVMVVTDREAKPSRRLSMFVVPKGTPGVTILRDVATLEEDDEQDTGTHAYLRYENVRLPADAMLGEPGDGFKIAQARLGGGRVHHAMRTLGMCNRAFEMMLERAVSRRTDGGLLADKQFVQAFIADSAIELRQYRLLVLHAAWTIDTKPHSREARLAIGMCKVAMANIAHDIIRRAVHLHGSLGVTHETPLAEFYMSAPLLALADGPTEVHKVQVARAMLKDAVPATGLFPTEHIPTRRAAARQRYADVLAQYGLQ
jgi:acyl-CoA dehydrogenase